MIVNLKKHLFWGSKEAIAEFFSRAQEAGCIEFLMDQKKKKEVPDEVKVLSSAIKILRKQPVKEAGSKESSLESAHEVAKLVVELGSDIEKLGEQKRYLESEIARVAPFGDFSFDDIAYIEKQGNKVVQFYCVKTSKAHEVEKADSLIYVGTEYDLDYFIAFHDEIQSFPGVIELHFDKTVGKLRNQLAFVNETLCQIEAELKGYAKYLEFLRDALLGSLDVHLLEKVQGDVDFAVEGSVFSIEGWVPHDQLDQLEELSQDLPIAYEVIDKDAGEKVPTCMKNEKFNAIGEDLVRVYDIPSSEDRDPSGWVVWFFALFFAMILADGGYGFLFLGLGCFLKWKFPKPKPSAKRFQKLLFLLSTSCILWGIATGSFFGISIGPKSPISKAAVLTHLAAKKATYHARVGDETHQEWVESYPAIAPLKDGYEILDRVVEEQNGRKKYPMLSEYSNHILLEFSLLIGVIHISLSLLRYLRRSWANLGWVLFAVGGYLYFPVALNAVSLVEFLGIISKSNAETIGLQLLYVGLGLSVVLALFQKKLKGIGEIVQVISVFADILSYLRLYALALASTIMAETFNDMGLGAGFVFGVVILLIGHSINILLGTMGGVIHGLRLNFIEWYHYSFEGEGKLFNPLRRLRMKQE